jgi:hypothetical protein
MEYFGILQQIVPAVFPDGEIEQRQVEHDTEREQKVYCTNSPRVIKLGQTASNLKS